MSNRTQKINDYTEDSDSSPQHTRPTDKQMGLGTHDLIVDTSKKKNNNKKTK